MKTGDGRLQCYLGKHIPKDMDKEAVKRDGWQQEGILVVSIDDPRLDMIGREFVKRCGEQLYGKRAKKK